jgi:hypothetical protein
LPDFGFAHKMHEALFPNCFMRRESHPDQRTTIARIFW